MGSRYYACGSGSVPHERIRHSDKFDDPNLSGEMQVTINLKKFPAGPSSASCKKESDVIPPEACFLGW